MTEREEQLCKRFKELAERAERTGRPMFTPFFSPADAALAYRVCDKDMITLWGGTEGTERMMVRFGEKGGAWDDGWVDKAGMESFGGPDTADFPIVLLKIAPKQVKFADRLSHRDFLGAIMNLGIERDVIGDILVKEKLAYVFVCEDMAEYIADSLDRVKHTSVRCEVSSEVPEEARPTLVEEEFSVASPRIDSIIAGVFHISRSEAKALFSAEAVLVDGRLCKNPGAEPPGGSTVSVRGHGKFIFGGSLRQTKKGRLVVGVSVYR